MKIVLSMCLGVASLIMRSQNLVPNPSFEYVPFCPQWDGLNITPPWFLGPSTEVLDTCNGLVPYISGMGSKDTTYPKHGKSFIGMHCFHPDNYREYGSVELVDSLRAGQCYYVEFYSKPDPYSPYLINNIAANFSDSSYNSINHLTAMQVPNHITRFGNPIISDTMNWSLINGIYEAHGGEKFITLGNFNLSQNTNSLFHPYTPFATSIFSYYFFDSVCVIWIGPSSPLPWNYEDKIIQVGDSVYVGNYLGGNTSIKWFTMAGNLIGTGPGIFVKPDSTSKYEVRIDLCAATVHDTLQVTVQQPSNTALYEVGSAKSVNLFPSPAKNEINLECSIISQSIGTVEIIDFSGSSVIIKNVSWFGGKTTIDVKYLQSGVYFLRFANHQGFKFGKKFTVQR